MQDDQATNSGEEIERQSMEPDEEPILAQTPPPLDPTTAIIRIGPAEDMAILALFHEAQKLKHYAEVRVISTVEDVKLAADDLNIVAKLKKALEERRKEYTAPINEHLRTVNDAFRTLVAPLDEADKITRGKVTAYREEEKRKADKIAEINRLRQEAARMEASMNDGELSEPTQLLEEAPAPPSRVRGEVATLGTMKVKKWELEDFSKVPDEYKIIDASKIGRVVRAGIPSIPGIRIFEEETMTVRGRS